MKAFDALGNEIVLGSAYGASRNSNGITTITVGEAVNIPSEGKVTLKVLQHKWCAYSDKPEDRIFTKKSVTYLSSGMFPVVLPEVEPEEVIFKIKVIKAGMETFWYADRIGETFYVSDGGEVNPNHYALEPDQPYYFEIDDVEIVK